MWNQILLEDLLHDISHFSRNCSASTYNLLFVPSLLLHFLLCLLLIFSKVLIFSLSAYTLPIQFSFLSITRNTSCQDFTIHLDVLWFSLQKKYQVVSLWEHTLVYLQNLSHINHMMSHFFQNYLRNLLKRASLHINKLLHTNTKQPYPNDFISFICSGLSSLHVLFPNLLGLPSLENNSHSEFKHIQ